MSLTTGSRLGPYEVTGRLGEGGMGEVWRATDTRLDREVAIKVLPAAFTDEKDRLARFEREAKLLAQLHHPNVASIFGLEDCDGVRALVMELVEGPTLADRLSAGALSLDESLSIARQIAEALEEAHGKGIIHRDLKPQNIKAPADAKVKVLDFGLAKAMAPPGTDSAPDLARSPVIMNSPTMTVMSGTELGVILGTAAYMAPEQARGGVVDKRADIWAFGVILFEMLSGRRLFAADTITDTIAEQTGRDLYTRPLDGSAAPRPFRTSRSEERNISFSPEGSWVVYQSDEIGRPEVYAQPFPGPGERIQISPDGGTDPRWARNGEIFYLRHNEVQVVAARPPGRIEFAAPRALFTYPIIPGSIHDTQSFDITRDGQRIIVVTIPQGRQPRQMEVVTDWTRELERLVPRGAR